MDVATSASVDLIPSPDSYPLSFAAVAPTGICTSFAGAEIAEVVASYGTPTFMYDAARISANVESLACFDVIRYAQKANSTLAVLDVVRRAGALVDATSAGECLRALAAGYPPHAVHASDPPPIVYTCDVFDRAALDLVIEHGIHVNLGSPDMLWQYAARAGRGCHVTLRINPGFGHGHSNKTNTGGECSKHGIWHEDLPGILQRAATLGVRIAGLHVHIGSGSDFEHLSRVCDAFEQLALVVGPQLNAISAGGGLPVAYARGDESTDAEAIRRYYELWDGVRSRLARAFGHALRLEIEPGRYLVAEAGVLLAEVRAVKRSGARSYALLDAGFNCLIRPALYGAAHPIALAPAAALPDAAERAASAAAPRPLAEYSIGGPLCESGDVFTVSNTGELRSVRLPTPAVGDVVVIGVCGAYGFSMASNYNSRALPAEVLVDDGGGGGRERRLNLVRERQPALDMMRGESIPRYPAAAEA